MIVLKIKYRFSVEVYVFVWIDELLIYISEGEEIRREDVFEWRIDYSRG